jgi:hypothetical protein
MNLLDDPLYLRAKAEADSNEIKVAQLILSYVRRTALSPTQCPGLTPFPTT